MLITKEDMLERMYKEMLTPLLNKNLFNEIKNVCDEYMARINELPKTQKFLMIFNVKGVVATINLIHTMSLNIKNYLRLRNAMLGYLNICFGQQRFF